MHPKFFSELHALMEKFIQQRLECNEWPDAITHPDMALNMAQAAAVVFNTTVGASKYTQEQVED